MCENASSLTPLLIQHVGLSFYLCKSDRWKTKYYIFKFVFLVTNAILYLFICFFLFFYGHTCGTCKFQELNPSRSCHLHCSCGNAWSFNPLCWAEDGARTSVATQAAAVRFSSHCATAGTPEHTAFFFFFFFFLWPHPWHMEVPRLGVESKLQLPAYTTATAMLDLSCVFKLHYRSWQP